MKIEIATKKEDPPKVKGDLLEVLSKELLNSQNYDVTEEIRVVGAELDLLCTHRVSKKIIYVECKAKKEKISAPIMRQLVGSVASYDYSEGWLISTSELGKDAKGFAEMWSKKPIEESSKMSFYHPELIINSLISSNLIISPPKLKAQELVGESENLGNWTLLISEYGKYWTVFTLQGGAPFGVLIYCAHTGKHIQDETTIDNLSKLETTITEYNLTIGIAKKEVSLKFKSIKLPNVVEVQVGDSWDDYRPARPTDFIGRDDLQKDILNFLNQAREKKSGTRIFAITGNSGLGKSSLIAKVRDRSRNIHYKKKYFTFAVDIRGAKTPTYITASLMQCFQEAQKAGFGKKIALQLTDPASPIESESIEKFLDSVQEKNQVICLIFDQFEELYSKTELFGVFHAANDLMKDVAAFKGNFILGFAWKTDSTTQQDHPAYHIWHELSNYRKLFKLSVFNNGEITKSISAFEKEVHLKLNNEIKHQVTNSCQGFPWLLKKLCINIYESLKKGKSAESVLFNLDVRKLFEDDIANLLPAEHTCLKLIAQKAPAEWNEIIEISGVPTLRGLINKRLVVRSGDRLNIYWDIFKDYLLTGNIPVVPFNYIPTTDITSMLKVMNALTPKNYITSNELSDITRLNERTIGNIGADLIMFGMAERDGTSLKCQHTGDESKSEWVLEILRDKLNKHSLKLNLYKEYPGKTISKKQILTSFKKCMPTANFGEKTWTIYSNRLTNYLIDCGFLTPAGKDLVVQDLGSPMIERKKKSRRGRQTGGLFTAPTSPSNTCQLVEFLKIKNEVEQIKDAGLKNALSILLRFEIVSIIEAKVVLNNKVIEKYGGIKETVWGIAKNEKSIVKCLEILNLDSNVKGIDLGNQINVFFDLNWTQASMRRSGNALRQWSMWILEGIKKSDVPTPPGRSK